MRCALNIYAPLAAKREARAPRPTMGRPRSAGENVGRRSRNSLATTKGALLPQKIVVLQDPVGGGL